MSELLRYFRPADPEVDVAALDRAVLAFWDEHGTFQASVERRPAERSFVFYDGPPFATGLPHYGHIMTSIVKDVVPRFQTMKGRRVERRFGWDCHGVPVEFELEKELGLGGRADIEAMGVAGFNEACRGIVLRYTREWESVVRRVGRWVDFSNDYKTMDRDYMESVWWVFKTLWDRGLIYRDYKVVHYSWRLSTPYSNFEATLDDAYRERQDPSVVVGFELDGDGARLLAWTTTPWTLPSNMALAVNPELEYARVEADGATYLLAAERVAETFDGRDHRVLERVAGASLVGRRYRPLLPYFADRADDGAFRVLAGAFVTADDGTGVVHLAPAFGEDDFELARAEGVPLVNPVDDAGAFTEEVADFAGLNVFEANAPIVRHLRETGRLFSQRVITHSYPHDWRTDTPLIYRAIPSWYVRVTAIKERLLANNRKTAWYPHHVGEGAFGTWLENARDWSISRNRFWGTPIPIWQCGGCDDQAVVGSVSELQALSGRSEIPDLHSHHVDAVTFPCPSCAGEMRRVSEVLDCWFESGSMPYAQAHYPFEHEGWFERNFPADFIVEYIGQTRGWFYTLNVISSALFDEPVARHAVAHGILLGDDGRKMSKRLRNYPEVSTMLERYGADALRLYLMGHPALDGNDSAVTEEGIADMLRRFVLPVWNAFSFLTRYADIDGWRPEMGFGEGAASPPVEAATTLDRWIVSRTHVLARTVEGALTGYDLRGAVGALLAFVDDLNNWYIRRSRGRFWSAEKGGDKLAAYRTLHEVLVLLCRVAAPLTPFVTEAIFQTLTGRESLHLEDWPEPDETRILPELNRRMAMLRQVASLGLAARARAGVKVRQPLASLGVRTSEGLDAEDVALLEDELNVKAVRRLDDVSEYAAATLRPRGERIGPRFGRATSAIIAAVKRGEVERLPDGRYRVAGSDAWTLDADAIEVRYDAREGFASETHGDLVVVLDLHLTDALRHEGLARDLVRHVQTLRKEADYRLDDRIVVAVGSRDARLLEALDAFGDWIEREVLAEALIVGASVGEHGGDAWDLRRSLELEGSSLEVALRRA